MLLPVIACVMPAALAVVEVPAAGNAVEDAPPAPTVPVQSALLGQQAMFPASSRAQLVFLGQQALLLPTEEQEIGHLESRRKRSKFMKYSSLDDSSESEAKKGEYSTASAGGKPRQAMRA